MERLHRLPDRGRASPFFPEDRGVVPTAIEDDSDAAWAEYRACCEALDVRVAELRAEAAHHARRVIHRASLARQVESMAAAELPAPAPMPAAAPKVVTLDDLMRLVRLNARVCPQPAAWRRLYLLLPVRAERSPCRAPFPIGRTAWASTPELAKAARLREHLLWAAEHGALPAVHALLSELAESEWHHLVPEGWPALD